jgi:hypothetical protein
VLTARELTARRTRQARHSVNGGERVVAVLGFAGCRDRRHRAAPTAILDTPAGRAHVRRNVARIDVR